jgi:hypothetical protein
MTDVKRPNNSELLQRIVDDMSIIKTDIAVIKKDVTFQSDLVLDHETRIRELEKARWQSAWITGVLSAVITSSIVGVLLKLIQ